uniref:Uncharacterized protein n=1 Tax=Acrobeloides nanus TaxID=290746 RepID=A0A914EKT9_9BILA
MTPNSCHNSFWLRMDPVVLVAERVVVSHVLKNLNDRRAPMHLFGHGPAYRAHDVMTIGHPNQFKNAVSNQGTYQYLKKSELGRMVHTTQLV